MTVQPRRRPVPAATKTAVSSSMPCGRISPRKVSSRPAEDIRPMPTARLSTLMNRIQITGMQRNAPRTRHMAAAWALFVHTWAANEAAGWLE